MIVCAAVQWTNPINGLEMTIGCIRHADGLAQFNTLRELGQVVNKEDVEQGFLDHDGKFYSRSAAYTIAKYCGQLSTTTLANKHGSQELFSEDLY
nr:MAG TPA: hypothetical protein [Caudoviricetes sp.]